MNRVVGQCCKKITLKGRVQDKWMGGNKNEAERVVRIKALARANSGGRR